jgi:hypothetical protein
MTYGIWRPDGRGVQPGGHVGGDIQTGESYSVRYCRPDMPGSLITRTAYPVEYDECPGEHVVQIQTEWLVCTDPSDPGGTEIWSDYAYDDDSEIYGSAAAAESAARKTADQMLGEADIETWNGLPDH